MRHDETRPLGFAALPRLHTALQYLKKAQKIEEKSEAQRSPNSKVQPQHNYPPKRACTLPRHVGHTVLRGRSKITNYRGFLHQVPL